MSAATRRRAASIDAVSTRVYEVPTATPTESDGTLTWSATTLVAVTVSCDGVSGLGYTYCHPAAAEVIDRTLADIIRGSDPLLHGRVLHAMRVAVRNLGHAGVAAMAVSAVDIALWDLKARLLGVCLADALPRCHERIAAYGSGGFTDYDEARLREQVAGWARSGLTRVKIKVGRRPEQDIRRVLAVQEAVGADVTVMVDANGAYAVGEARGWARRFAELGVDWLEEPVSFEDVAGLAEVRRAAPAGLEIAAGEYGWDLPDLERLLAGGAVDVLQADVTRCGGITAMLRLDGLCRARNLAFSAHCAPSVSAHVCCAMQSARHVEYFFDHRRIEDLLFSGAASVQDGWLVPDRSRAGLGLELDDARAERYRMPGR